MRKPYFGFRRWRYRVGRDGAKGVVDINVTTGNYQHDDAYARSLVRKEHNLKKLPKGSKVWPDYPPC